MITLPLFGFYYIIQLYTLHVSVCVCVHIHNVMNIIVFVYL